MSESEVPSRLAQRQAAFQRHETALLSVRRPDLGVYLVANWHLHIVQRSRWQTWMRRIAQVQNLEKLR